MSKQWLEIEGIRERLNTRKQKYSFERYAGILVSRGKGLKGFVATAGVIINDPEKAESAGRRLKG